MYRVYFKCLFHEGINECFENLIVKGTRFILLNATEWLCLKAVTQRLGTQTAWDWTYPWNGHWLALYNHLDITGLHGNYGTFRYWEYYVHVMTIMTQEKENLLSDNPFSDHIFCYSYAGTVMDDQWMIIQCKVTLFKYSVCQLFWQYWTITTIAFRSTAIRAVTVTTLLTIAANTVIAVRLMLWVLPNEHFKTDMYWSRGHISVFTVANIWLNYIMTVVWCSRRLRVNKISSMILGLFRDMVFRNHTYYLKNDFNV